MKKIEKSKHSAEKEKKKMDREFQKENLRRVSNGFSVTWVAMMMKYTSLNNSWSCM